MSACISLTRVQFEVKFAYSEMHKSEVHHSLSFDRCIHQCNTTPYQHVEHCHHPDVPSCPAPSHSPAPLPTARGSHHSDFFHHRLTFPMPRLSYKWNHSVCICVRCFSSSRAFLRLIHVVAYINHLFHFIAEQYPENGYITVF